jgi:IclR family mhp operon transcriptional activator
LAVLQAVNAAGSLCMMDMARTVRLPYASIARIVSTLVQAGMIEQEPDRKTYRPTALVRSLSSGYEHFGRLGALCKPHLTDLTLAFGWPTVVSTRVGASMVVRECTHSISPFTLAHAYPGQAFPLWPSAAGRLHMAFETERERSLARQGGAESPIGLSDPKVLSLSTEDALAAVRARGYEVARRSTFAAPSGKTSAIAVPILVDGRIRAVLSLIFFASAMTMAQAEDLYVGPLLNTAHTLGETLAGSQTD